MSVQLYQEYSRQDVFDTLGFRKDQIIEFCDGEFAVIDSAILCFFSLERAEHIYLASSSKLVWIPQENRTSYVEDHTWLPKLARETIDSTTRQKIRAHHLFVCKNSSDLFVYLGEAHLGSYGYAGIYGNSARFRLKTRLPLSVWVQLGGSLEPKDSLGHLSVTDDLAVPLRYHQHTLDLLHLKLRQNPIHESYFNQLEDFLSARIPEAVREWYGLSGSMEILDDIVGFNEPNKLDNMQLDLDWIEAQKKASSSMTLLPLVSENQGVWVIAVPLGATENPPVYFAYYDDNEMEWQQHAASFSDFIHAWAWDAQTQHKDFVLNVSDDVSDEDIELIERTFDRGPITHAANQYFLCDEFHRFIRDGQIVTIGKTGADRVVWFSARTREAMAQLLSRPLSKGSILSLHPNLEIDMERPFLW